MKNFWNKLNTPILALAPMAGFTDSAFRKICRKFGADVVYSEMASASGLFYNPKKTLEILKFNRKERPYVVQLFGSNSEHFAKATKIITREIKPNGIDINMGCPVKKVMKTGAGCALMTDYKLARKIISTVCKNTNLPISIKIRAGISPRAKLLENKGMSAVNFIKKIKDLPFSAVMIHCRTYEQRFAGKPDYSIAEKIKKIIPDKIVLANGGIDSSEDAIKILNDHPGIDGLGIARGALGHPWIFEEIKEALVKQYTCHPELVSGSKNKKIPKQFRNDIKFIRENLLFHLRLATKNKGPQGLKEMRAHFGWYIKGFPGASELRRKLIVAKNLKEVDHILGK